MFLTPFLSGRASDPQLPEGKSQFDRGSHWGRGNHWRGVSCHHKSTRARQGAKVREV